jgi:hypothetical protein
MKFLPKFYDKYISMAYLCIQRFIYNRTHPVQKRGINRFLDGIGSFLHRIGHKKYATGRTRHKARLWAAESQRERAEAQNKLRQLFQSPRAGHTLLEHLVAETKEKIDRGELSDGLMTSVTTVLRDKEIYGVPQSAIIALVEAGQHFDQILSLSKTIKKYGRESADEIFNALPRMLGRIKGKYTPAEIYSLLNKIVKKYKSDAAYALSALPAIVDTEELTPNQAYSFLKKIRSKFKKLAPEAIRIIPAALRAGLTTTAAIDFALELKEICGEKFDAAPKAVAAAFEEDFTSQQIINILADYIESLSWYPNSAFVALFSARKANWPRPQIETLFQELMEKGGDKVFEAVVPMAKKMSPASALAFVRKLPSDFGIFYGLLPDLLETNLAPAEILMLAGYLKEVFKLPADASFEPLPPEIEAKLTTQQAFHISHKIETRWRTFKAPRMIVAAGVDVRAIRLKTEGKHARGKIHMLFGEIDPEALSKINFSAERKVLIVESTPISPTHLLEHMGGEAFENAQACIQDEFRNDSAVRVLKRDIRATADKLREEGRLETDPAYAAFIREAEMKGCDVVYDEIEPEALFSFWLAEKYKNQFVELWSRPDPKLLDQNSSQEKSHRRITKPMLEAAISYYRHLFDHYVKRNSKFEGQLSHQVFDNDIVISLRSRANEGFYTKSFGDAHAHSHGPASFIDQMISAENVPELLNNGRLARVIKGLIFEYVKDDPMLSSQEAYDLVDKLPEKVSKLRSFLAYYSKQFCETIHPSRVTKMIIERLEGMPKRVILNRRRWLAYAGGFAGASLASRVAKRFLQERHAEKTEEARKAALIQEAKENADIYTTSTPVGKFFIWFGMHNLRRDEFVTVDERYMINLPTMKEIARTNRLAAYAPEISIDFESVEGLFQVDDIPTIHGRRFKTNIHEQYMFEVSQFALPYEVREYLKKHKVPLLLIDSMMPTAGHNKIKALEKLANVKEPSEYLPYYGPPLLGATLLGRQLAKGSPGFLDLRRREFIKAGALAALGIGETYHTMSNDKIEPRPMFGDMPFSLQFRSALFAYKLLHWAETQGTNPAVFSNWGYAHKKEESGIPALLKKGKAACLQQITEICLELGLRREDLGAYIHKGIYIDPTQPPEKMVKIIEFEELKAAIPE